MDDIFKALNDETRRALLDALRDRDGQSLGDLESRLAMTRFGVMKHLRVLEDANLITTVKKGRFKYHYLNALPLQEVIDRWIEPLLAKPGARAVLTLKSQLEGKTAMPLDTAKPDLVLHTYIDCAHDALWDALTRGDLMRNYHFASQAVDGNHESPGDVITLSAADGSAMLVMKLLSIDPKSRIEMTFQLPRRDAAASRCIYLVDPSATGMKLTIEHYDLGPGSEHVNDGWTRFMAGLKTWMETGKTRRFGPEMA